MASAVDYDLSVSHPGTGASIARSDLRGWVRHHPVATSVAFGLLGNAIDLSVLPGNLNAANGLLVPLPTEAFQGDVYRAILLLSTVTIVAVAAVLVIATGGRLGYRAPRAE